MSYTVSVKVGKGFNRSTSQSIPLPNKDRVVNYIKNNPMIKSNTNIELKNNTNKELITGKRAKFILRKF